MRSFRKNRLLACAVVVAVLITMAPAPREASGQVPDPNALPNDPQYTYLMSAIALVGLVIGKAAAGPFALVAGYLLHGWLQAGLWSLAYEVDAALLSAWTVESLLEMNYQVRGTVVTQRAADGPAEQDWMTSKLRTDERVLVERIRSAERQGAVVSEERALDEGRLEAVRRRLESLERSNLVAKGRAIIEQFDTLRRSVIQGGAVREMKDRQSGLVRAFFTPQMISDSSALGRALADYVQTAVPIEQEFLTPVRVPVTIGGRLQERELPASSMTQLRLLVANQSPNLVFFLRVVSKDERGQPVVRGQAGRARWITLYPQSEAVRLGAPRAGRTEGGAVGAGTAGGAAATDAVSVQLPWNIWVPVKLGDRLELRVATYGEHRQIIRWLSLRGQWIRPDLHSLRRGFYYLGYEVAFQTGVSNRIPTRRWVSRERAQWQFTGLWAGQVEENVPTSLSELYGLPEWTANQPAASLPPTLGAIKLQLVNDHVAWTIPDTLAAIEANPALAATVDAEAEIAYRTRNVRDKNVKETGSGELTMLLQIW